MSDETGISTKLNRLTPLERSGDSGKNVRRQEMFFKKKKREKQEEGSPFEISQGQEEERAETTEGPSPGKIVDIII
jgi:hypothetical protein